MIVVLNEHVLAETEPNQICGTINKKCGDCSVAGPHQWWHTLRGFSHWGTGNQRCRTSSMVAYPEGL